MYMVIPDYLNGDAVPPDALDNSNPRPWSHEWLQNHMQEKTHPVLNKVIAGLVKQGVKEFGAIGYCFGNCYVFDLVFNNVIKASVVCHPSLLEVPEDLEKYKKEAKAPLLLNTCTINIQFPPECQAKADKILDHSKFSPAYKRVHWEGCTHRFAVHGDLSDPKVKAGKEGAFKSAVEWFIKYIGRDDSTNGRQGKMREGVKL
ncbi:hypothetical protein D9756_002687 [Leucocoprinus leucothites]|uniref:Dienelactone hydrolase domain-containing protein n=1 Tax=Leucocoprinus leucothites TaxID=201217 RepID=A0A8H5GC48_9AGAR|nr:hypothetical protein D9756_002687 [Leucoagaricus leucothites]